jgi:deoxycytidine triphosphate deaminase
LGVKERYSSKTELIGDVNKDGNKKFTIRPGEYYLVTTMETIHSPAEKVKYDESLPEGYIIPKVFPRTSLQRGGVSLHFSNTNPGYKGPLAFGIKNLGNQDFVFELGARMFSIEYVAVIGDIKRAYSGQHQGGRVTSGGQKEIQN